MLFTGIGDLVQKVRFTDGPPYVDGEADLQELWDHAWQQLLLTAEPCLGLNWEHMDG